MESSDRLAQILILVNMSYVSKQLVALHNCDVR
jgi:hypothetical protein